MRFDAPLVEARLLCRYKRFLADVAFSGGNVATVHCANPGSMIGLAEPGMRVFLSKSNRPGRKLPWSWELVEADGTLVGINTTHPNRLVADAIRAGVIAELTGYERLTREVRYGKNSRIDILLSDDGRPDAYVEVKNVHFSRRSSLAEFPDSVTARGLKHLEELSNMVRNGRRAIMLYLVHRADAKRFTLAGDIDPAYAAGFRRARRAGVEMLAYDCSVAPDEVTVRRRVAIVD